MKNNFLLLAVLLLSASFTFAQPTKLSIGQAVPDFALKDLNGKMYGLQNYRGQNLVVGFIGVKCSIANAYNVRISSISADYHDKGFAFLAINSNVNEPVRLVKQHAEKYKFSFPVLKDENNVVADLYGASVTPEIYVIDKAGVLRYHGRVDGSSDIARVERHDLRVTLDELSANQPISKPELKSFGCEIKRTFINQDLAQAKSAKKITAKKPVPQTAVKTPAAKPATENADDPKVVLLKPADFPQLKTESEGKVLLINFWATWCAPCVAEFPEFVKIDQEYKARGVRMVSISTDDATDLKTLVVPFLKKQNATFDSFLADTDDPQQLLDLIDKSWSGALPATFVLDKTGKLIFSKYGIIDRDELLKQLDAALK